MSGRSPIAILAAASLLVPASVCAGPIEKEKCTFNGRKLYGKVQFVCGKWQTVTSFPDFKVQVVDSFPDIKIEYVKTFPGVQ